MTDLNALAHALAACPAARKPAARDLVAMTAKGVNHDHYRLVGRGLVLRVPRATPWAGIAEEQLRIEAEAFRRAEPAGVTPRLLAVLPPGASLPRGALLVEEVAGPPPRLPGDLPALAQALARLHALKLPRPDARPPLPDHGALGPMAATLAVIAGQRVHIEAARVPPETRAALDAEYDWARGCAAKADPAEQPLALVGTDTHPGNFVMRAPGEAVLVDLERACYGAPAIDLAHGTLMTSTTWDLEVQAVLDRADVERFYRCYLDLVDTAQARRLRPWLVPARRLTWLRTMMWAVRWRALAEGGGLDLDPRLASHIRQRLDDFFAPATVARLRAEWLEGPSLAI